MAKAQSASRRQPNIVTRLFRETLGELRKVSWPSRDEATRLTIIVLVVLAVMSALLGSLDFLFSKLIGLVIGLGG
jgi:preprotein translocase subunit SecE